MLKGLKKNKKGVVFIVVLMIIIVMMVLCVSIISMNMNQILIAENEIKRIQAETLAVGGLAYTFANQMSASAGASLEYSKELDNVTFTILSNVGNSSTGPLKTNPVTIDVYY